MAWLNPCQTPIGPRKHWQLKYPCSLCSIRLLFASLTWFDKIKLNLLSFKFGLGGVTGQLFGPCYWLCPQLSSYPESSDKCYNAFNRNSTILIPIIITDDTFSTKPAAGWVFGIAYSQRHCCTSRWPASCCGLACWKIQLEKRLLLWKFFKEAGSGSLKELQASSSKQLHNTGILCRTTHKPGKS